MRIIKAHHCESIDEDLVYESKAQEQNLRTILLLQITKSRCKKKNFYDLSIYNIRFRPFVFRERKKRISKRGVKVCLATDLESLENITPYFPLHDR